MNVRRSRSRSRIAAPVAAGAAALGLLTLSACGSSNAADGKDGDGLSVVASFYPMQFLAEEIGGEYVSVNALTKPGVEPHDLELKPRQIAELGESDMVLYLGGLQPAVDEAVEQSSVKKKVDAASLTDLDVHSAGDGHDHGGHEDEHGHEEGHGEHAEEEAGEATDPHFWLDPVKYAEAAKGVGKALQKADPDHAADYKKNTAALVKKLEALDKDFEDGLKNTDTKTFITAHSAFGYLAERYGLDQEGVSGLDPKAEPSPARMKELQQVAKEEKVSTIFFETLASDKTAKTLAADAGLKTDVLDPLEGITDKSKGADYIEVMHANLTALEKALGAK
ncbi:metal ABC transporter substrate-binding protein [Streptomyces cavernicola]|uniref:Metal ABC transporter substrate-binding protein n=1 Tax=Streptomyces cavernicola TaxID=3043613 RepID=A0ABT6SGC3_9ACTN|nr:metal ABC transporter substrate-binding protein [Streptomyces sp. B-S-A6]MDI3406331.1 metal ABC transporter substrate-binding protein [Streptomyces sp. B-S-A6]